MVLTFWRSQGYIAKDGTVAHARNTARGCKPQWYKTASARGEGNILGINQRYWQRESWRIGFLLNVAVILTDFNTEYDEVFQSHRKKSENRSELVLKVKPFRRNGLLNINKPQ